MTVKELADKLDLKLFSGIAGLDREIKGGYTSDLLSDVMGFAKEGSIWITLQKHRNIMAVASLRDLSAILLVKGFEPEPDVVELSEKEGIPVLGTNMQAFEISGEIYNLL